MKIAAAAESVTDEPQAAATPETIRKTVAMGAPMLPPKGAGTKSGFSIPTMPAAGAAVTTDAANGAEMVLHDCPYSRCHTPPVLAGVRPTVAW